MGKQYAEPDSYEAKLDRVMMRLGIEKYNYDWSRFACWVEFWYKSAFYRFEHSVENAQAHGQKIKYGSDVFAQMVLALEDIARMTDRGIYELQTWIVGLKALPAARELPKCFTILGFDKIPENEKEIAEHYRCLSKSCHPDIAGGADELFIRITAAKKEALDYLNQKDGTQDAEHIC